MRLGTGVHLPYNRPMRRGGFQVPSPFSELLPPRQLLTACPVLVPNLLRPQLIPEPELDTEGKDISFSLIITNTNHRRSRSSSRPCVRALHCCTSLSHLTAGRQARRRYTVCPRSHNCKWQSWDSDLGLILENNPICLQGRRSVAALAPPGSTGPDIEATQKTLFQDSEHG